MQLGAVRQPVQLRDIVERLAGLAGKQMRLRVVDHLHAMLDRCAAAR